MEFIQGDFREDEVLKQLRKWWDPAPWILLFPTWPQLVRVGIADAARIQHVCELAMEFSCAHLKPNGVLIVKAFHGSGFSQIVQSFKQRFKRVVERKPKASGTSPRKPFWSPVI